MKHAAKVAGPILFGGVEKIIDFLRQKQLLASTMDCTRYANFI